MDSEKPLKNKQTRLKRLEKNKQTRLNITEKKKLKFQNPCNFLKNDNYQ